MLLAVATVGLSGCDTLMAPGKVYPATFLCEETQSVGVWVRASTIVKLKKDSLSLSSDNILGSQTVMGSKTNDLVISGSDLHVEKGKVFGDVLIYSNNDTTKFSEYNIKSVLFSFKSGDPEYKEEPAANLMISTSIPERYNSYTCRKM